MDITAAERKNKRREKLKTQYICTSSIKLRMQDTVSPFVKESRNGQTR